MAEAKSPRAEGTVPIDHLVSISARNAIRIGTTENFEFLREYSYLEARYFDKLYTNT